MDAKLIPYFVTCPKCGGDSGVHTWTTDGSTLVPVCREEQEPSYCIDCRHLEDDHKGREAAGPGRCRECLCRMFEEG